MEQSFNNQKEIWITTDWEASPLMSGKPQLGRMNSLADFLSTRGYKVTLWFTTFSHPEKKHIFESTRIIVINDNLRIVALHSAVGYKRNTSPCRFLYHWYLAKEMNRLIKDKQTFPTPDIIFCSYPTEQFCRVAYKYGQRNHVPVIMDARDQWPDIFERALPKSLQIFARLLLYPLKRKTAKTFSMATAICAMSPIQLDWALNYAGREQSKFDRYVFIGCKTSDLLNDVREKQLEEWRKIGVSEGTWNICFFSTLSKTAIDLDTVISAVREVYLKHPEIRLVIGGKGDEENRLREQTRNDTFIHMMGWMSQDQMNSLMSISKIGLLCYRNTKDFKDGWGNKVGQYLSYGLPLLTSAQGFAKTYISQFDCGESYGEGNISDLVQKLLYLIENPLEQKKLSKNASRCYDTDFAEDVVMQQFEKMILDVCNEYKRQGELL